MYRATSILTALLFVSSLSAGKTSFASEETSSGATKTRISPSSEPSQERNVLRQLAVALAAGGDALSRFRGSTIRLRIKREKSRSILSILRSQAWIAVLTTSLTMSRATAQRLETKKKLANASYGLSTNCELFCRPIVGQEKRHSRESIRSEVILMRTEIPTPTLIST
jgi:hypothetical protein